MAVRCRPLRRRSGLARAVLAAGALLLIAQSPTQWPRCADGICTARLTAPQLLIAAEKAVLAKDYENARPLLNALAHAPDLQMETNFLEGYVAVETGDLKNAVRRFRTVLRDRPDMTRARLELARALLMQGKREAADHHLRLAQQDRALPPEIERTIRAQRGIIRDHRKYHLSIDFGLAPDSNVNNATSANAVDSIFGPGTLVLDQAARRRSGIGQTATIDAGVRLRINDGMAMVVDASAQGINQPGTDADDVSALLAAGPEVTFSGGARLGIQAIGAQRWYGGRVVQRGVGAKVTFQKELNHGQRIGLQAEARRVDSPIASAYDGWQYSGYATYERVIRQSMVASVTGFLRREDLQSRAYSNTEVGMTAGIGGELSQGLNAGISATVSRALFDAAIPILSARPRQDWRLGTRASLGIRSVRVLGFSPSFSYTFNRTISNVNLYDSTRHRFAFEVARYF